MSDQVDVKFGAQVGELIAGVGRVKSEIQGLAEGATQIREQMVQLAQTIAAAFAVREISEFIERLSELGEQTERTAKILGLTTEEVGQFNFIAKLSGGSAESMAVNITRLEKSMAAAKAGTGPASEAFKALGVDVSTSDGKLKSLSRILPEIADRFSKAADGPQKTAIAMALAGRGGAQLIPLLDLGAEKFAQLAEEARKTGTVLSEETAAGMAETHEQIEILQASTEGLSIQLFNEFKPVIDDILKSMIAWSQESIEANKSGVDLTTVFGLMTVAIDGLAISFRGIIFAIQELWSFSTVAFLEMGNALGTFALELQYAFTGQWGKLIAAWKVGHQEAKDIVTNTIRDMKQEWQDYYAFFDKVSQNLGPKPKKAEGGDGAKNPELASIENAEAAKKALESEIALIDRKKAAAVNDYQTEMALENQKLAIIRKSLGEQSKEYQNALAEKEKMERDHQIMLNKIQLESDKTQAQLTKIGLDEKKAQLDQDVALHKITQSQKYEILKQYEEQAYQLDKKLLEREKQLDAQTLLQKKTLEDKLLILKKQHEAQMQALTIQSTNKQMEKYHQMFDALRSGFKSAINGILQGTQTWQQAMKNIFSDLLSTIVGFLIDWAVQQAEVFLLQALFGKTAAMSNIGAYAAEAGAGAYAATAAIPYVGPFLAPGAAAVAYAGALSFEGLASAAGGWDRVPSDQISQIHKNEMVLSAPYAEGLRSLIEGGGKGGAPVINLEFHANGRLLTSEIKDHAKAIATAVARHWEMNPNSRPRH